MITIDVINESAAVADALLAEYVAALQIQVDRDFRPAWSYGTPVTLNFVPRGGTPRAWTWWLVVLDNSDQAGALGYHDLTPQDQPLGKVFAQTDLTYGSAVSVTLSHELLEMLADPRINRLAQMGDGLLYMVEACDAVEADAQAYSIDNTLVSNFVLPAWFDPANRNGPFDFKSVLKGPCPTLAPGGYIGYLDPNTGRWGQLFHKAMDQRERIRARVYTGSRRSRRAIQPHDRERSTSRGTP